MTRDENDRKQDGTLPSDPEADAVPMPPAGTQAIGALLDSALARAQRRRDGEEKPIPLPWTYYAEALGGRGMWPGMHVLVAGTGAGKTTFAMQIALGAAKVGHPVVYVGLELEAEQVALRLLGEHTQTAWSKFHLGNTDAAWDRTAKARTDLGGLPFYVATGTATGWPASELTTLATGVRQAHPEAPAALLVVDFLQLVGEEPGTRKELRERIGNAAYQARTVARDHNAAVLLVSSAARNHYGLLSSTVGEAGLSAWNGKRTIGNPDALVGLGKESGEIEYAADSVTVLARWPERLDTGERAVVCAVPKLRYGPPSWCALSFNGWRFHQMHNVHKPADLPAVTEKPKGKGKADTEPDDDEGSGRYSDL